MKNNCFLLMTLAAGLLSIYSCKKGDVKPKETVVYETDFSTDDGNWWTGTASNGTVASIKDGYYIFKTSSTGGQDAWLEPVFTNNITKSAVEASLKLSTTGDDTWGNGGLIWNLKNGSGNDSYRYYFFISYNGYFRIYGYPNGINGNPTSYVDWTINSAVKKEAFNKLRIESTAGTLHFLINGTEVYNMSSTGGTTLDQLGLSASKYTNLQVDYIRAVTF